MSAKLTPWFPADVKPVRVGLYQCREGSQLEWLWDGAQWMNPDRRFVCRLQEREWRGFDSDPSKAAK